MSPAPEIRFMSWYTMLGQKRAEGVGITEDDVSEIRQDINKFRFELLDILGKNKFDIGKIRSAGCYGGKRAKQMERRIMNGFTLEIYDLLKDSLDKQDKNKSVDIFQVMAEAMHKSKNNQQPVTSIGFTPTADYSPATVVAANKFKRFLGKHLKSQGQGGHGGTGTNNNVQYGSITAPCSPVKTREIGAEQSEQSLESDGEPELRCRQAQGSDRQRENGGSLSCSKLTKINNKKSGSITGGWI